MAKLHMTLDRTVTATGHPFEPGASWRSVTQEPAADHTGSLAHSGLDWAANVRLRAESQSTSMVVSSSAMTATGMVLTLNSLRVSRVRGHAMASVDGHVVDKGASFQS